MRDIHICTDKFVLNIALFYCGVVCFLFYLLNSYVKIIQWKVLVNDLVFSGFVWTKMSSIWICTLLSRFLQPSQPKASYLQSSLYALVSSENWGNWVSMETEAQIVCYETGSLYVLLGNVQHAQLSVTAELRMFICWFRCNFNTAVQVCPDP